MFVLSESLKFHLFSTTSQTRPKMFGNSRNSANFSYVLWAEQRQPKRFEKNPIHPKNPRLCSPSFVITGVCCVKCPGTAGACEGGRSRVVVPFLYQMPVLFA